MTIAEQIAAGIQAGWAKLAEALKSESAKAAEALTKERDIEKARADKATADLATMTKERDDLKALPAVENKELEKAKADLVTANAKIADLEKAAKTVSQTATELAAAQGIPAAQLPSTGASAALTDAQLLEQWNAITDPKARGEFYLKHFSPKFNKS